MKCLCQWKSGEGKIFSYLVTSTTPRLGPPMLTFVGSDSPWVARMPWTQNRDSYGEVLAEQILKSTYPCKRAGTPKTSKRRLPKRFFFYAWVYFNITLWHRSSQDHHRLQELHFYSTSPSITFAQVDLMLESCTWMLSHKLSQYPRGGRQTQFIWSDQIVFFQYSRLFQGEFIHVPPLFSEEVRRHLKSPRLFLLLLLCAFEINLSGWYDSFVIWDCFE